MSLNERIRLFADYLNNGGAEKISSPDLLKDLIKVEFSEDGAVIEETVSSLVRAALLAFEGTQYIPPVEKEEFLSEYETLVQKGSFFKQQEIRSKSEFDELFDVLLKSEDTLYRGVREAKWRLYSSLQRRWVEHSLHKTEVTYKEFLETLVDEARREQGEVLKKFLELNRIDPSNDVAVLSFLQHHGCPTPLLDWTYRPEVALFFAAKRAGDDLGSREIDGFFSLYLVEEEQVSESSLREVVQEVVRKQVPRVKKEFLRRAERDGVDPEAIEKMYTPEVLYRMAEMFYGKTAITGACRITELMKLPLAYFSDVTRSPELSFSLNNSMNIANQEGVFIWNRSPWKPLEYVGKELVDDRVEKQGYTFCLCYNIRKELASHVLARLDEVGINKEFIFPDPNRLAASSEKSAFMRLRNN